MLLGTKIKNFFYNVNYRLRWSGIMFGNSEGVKKSAIVEEIDTYFFKTSSLHSPNIFL